MTIRVRGSAAWFPGSLRRETHFDAGKPWRALDSVRRSKARL